MRTVYEKYVWLPLVIFLLSQVHTNAQVLNDKFISPRIFRQGQTSVIKATWADYLYVAGDFDFHGDRPIKGIVRLKPDGLLDTSFDPEVPEEYTEGIVDLEVLPTDYVAFISTDRNSETRLIILARSGKWLMTIENEGVTAIEPDGQGGFYVGTEGGLITYYNADLSFGRNVTDLDGRVNDIQWQDEHITVAGEFSNAWDSFEGTNYPRKLLARFDRYGRVDKTFNANAVMQGHTSVGGIVLQSDGKVVPVKKYRFTAGHPGAMRLNKDGSRDMNFTSPFPGTLPFEDALLAYGNLTVLANNKIVRLHHNGSINTAFAPIDLNPGQVVLGGSDNGTFYLGNYQPATYGFAKFTAAGVRVNEYYSRLTRLGEIYSIDRTETSIWIGGDFVRVDNHFTRNVARLNLDGTVLTKFRSPIVAPVHTVEAVANARVLAQTSNRLYRLGSDGAIDPSFAYPYIPELKSIKKFIVQPDEKIIVGGNYRLFRLNANGSRDYTFDGDVGKEAIPGGDMDFDLDRNTGKIIYINWQYDYVTETTELIKLNPNGSRDVSFNPPTFPEYSFPKYSKVLALDNQEVLVMKHAYLLEDHRYDIVKLNADGSINEEFTDNLDSEYWWYEYAARFGDRIIVYRHALNDEEGNTSSKAMWLNGTPDPDFTIPASTNVINKFYSDNSTELFIAGTLGADRMYQIVKVTYPATAASAAIASAETDESGLRFYPNPVVSELTIEVKSQGTLNIFDRTGTNRMSVPVDETTKKIDLQQLQPGSYVIEVITNGNTYRKHLAKK
jgi:uncharacterized delta-60 repeat protein